VNCSTILRCILLFAAIAALFQSALAQYDRPAVCAEYVNSAAVFTGEVLSQRRIEMQGDRDPGWIYRVRVTKILKGSFHGIVEVYTSDTTIRFPLKVGTDFILFADDFKRGPIEIGEPTNSGPVSERKKTLATAQRCSSRRRASLE
jgi:hypothetical protein